MDALVPALLRCVRGECEAKRVRMLYSHLHYPLGTGYCLPALPVQQGVPAAVYSVRARTRCGVGLALPAVPLPVGMGIGACCVYVVQRGHWALG